MKKRIIVYLLTASVGFFTAAAAQAQDSTTVGQDLKHAASKTGKAIAKTAKKVGHKTAEIASKGKAGVVDKVYDGKQGLNGEKIYIDKDSKYYSIDKKGHKQYHTETQIKDKPGK